MPSGCGNHQPKSIAKSGRLKPTVTAKRRGFIYPSSEIYGGIGGFWDYGPLGIDLKRTVVYAA